MREDRTGAVPALLFLTRRSMANRGRSLLGRLRHIPYLLAVLAGLALVSLMLVPYLVVRDLDGGVEPTLFAAQPWAAPLAALALVTGATVWWARGRYDAALAFSPAETDLLVCGPVDRRTLVTYKLARSQIGIMLAVVWAVLFVGTAVSWPLRTASLWILVTTLHLHQVSSALVRTAALQGPAGLWRARVPLALFAAIVGTIVWTTAPVLPEAANALLAGQLEAAARLVAGALEHPAARVALLPAHLALAPLFAQGAGEWLLALPAAIALLALHFVWVIRTDAAFEEGAAAAGREQHRLRTTMLTRGILATLSRGRNGRRSRRSLVRLAPTGRPWVALLWKNVTMGVRSLSPALAIWLVLVMAPTVFLELDEGPEGILALLGSTLGGVAAMSVLFGPFVVRNDLRSDLEKAELLRTFPLTGTTLAGAETAASTLALTAAQLLLLIPAVLLLTPSVGMLTPPVSLGIVAAAPLVLPPMNALLVSIQTGFALFLPAWTSPGRERTGGLDQLGTRLLTALGTTVLGLMAAAPVLAAGAGIGFALRGSLGAPWALAAGAVGGWAVLVGEVLLLVRIIGAQWDALDIVEAGILR